MRKVKTEQDKVEFVKWVKRNGDVILACFFYGVKPEFREDFVEFIGALQGLL